MDDLGNLTVKFSEDMNTNFSLPFFNESFVNITILAKNKED
jgi:hypothetical protein